MPRDYRIIASDSSVYQGCSSYTDTIEKTSPALWFYVCSIYLMTTLYGYTMNIAKEIAFFQLKYYLNMPCPEFLTDLYKKKKKKVQEGLLRGKSITPDNLICWILLSGYWNGKYSQYAYDGGFGDLSDKAPILIDASDHGNIITAGKTTLSNDTLIHLVENQKKVLAQFIDFDDGRWYCFYRTQRSINGRETGSHGPHLHFISNAYGIDRDSVVNRFLNGDTPGNGFHVRLSEYEHSASNIGINLNL